MAASVLQAVVVFLFCLSAGLALICDRCENSPEICKNSKKTEDCSQYGSDQVCANFYYWSNGKAHSEKKCYQRKACERQAEQEDNFCGDNDGKDKPCRCCCTKYRCNRLEKGCVTESKCIKPKQPTVGTYDCPRNLRLGAICNFTCPLGYDLLGSKTIRCGIQSTGKLGWLNLGQRCKKIRCPVIEPLGNGTVTCANKGKYRGLPDFVYLGTICNFKCDPGFKLQGAKRTECLRSNKWTKKAPKCIPDPCDWFPPSSNRDHTCTNGNMLASKCTFKCAPGYKLIGNKQIQCVGDPKDSRVREWDKEPPKCVSVKCQPEQEDPINGKVECTNENFEHSVCTFTCDKGYDLDDTAKNSFDTKCVDDGDGDNLGEWTEKPKTCTKIKCQPVLKKPINGTIKCTDKNNLDSVCTFKCNPGYDLVGTTQTLVTSKCGNDFDGNSVGEWSLKTPPKCEKIICNPPHVDPENGKVTCTDFNFLGSVCTFRCNAFYDVDGTTKDFHISECVKDKSASGTAVGKWNPGPATCSPKKCRPVRKPVDGKFKCTSDNFVESTCTFRCDPGFELIGSWSITCRDQKLDGDNVAEWSAREPECSKIFCKRQDQDDTVTRVCDPVGGKVFVVGTVCTYKCKNEGHYMVPFGKPDEVVTTGSLDVECRTSKRWSEGAPTCVPIKCRPLKTPEFGHAPKCSNSRWYQSSCSFSCRSTYALTHEEPLVCESDGDNSDKTGKWSREEPTCKKNQCELFGRVNNGVISYTDKQKIGSLAKLKCNSDYTYKQFQDAECLDSGPTRSVPDWSRRENVCCVRCLFNKRLKIVSVIDETIGNSEENWESIATWHFYIIEHLFTNGYDVNFGMVLYNTKVNTETSTRLNKLKRYSDVEDVQYEILDKTHGGVGSNTGAALDYTMSKYFHRKTKEEPYVILLKSDTSSSDEMEPAEKIRNADINLMALGFKSGNWRAKQKKLAAITGIDENALMISDLRDINRVAEVITEITKARGCDSSSRNQPCS
ncbi:P-selectin-like [Styela clava]